MIGILPILLRRALRVISTTVTFVLMLALAIRMHASLPVAKRAALEETNALLAREFAGTTQLVSFSSLSALGLSDAHIVVRDADGTLVIDAQHTNVRLSVFGAIRRAIQSSHIELDEVHVGSLEVNLDARPDGTLRIVGAFEPKTPTSRPATPAPKSPLQVLIGSIEVDHAWVHGSASGQWIDSDVSHLKSGFSYSADGIEIKAISADLVARAMPRGANPHGHIDGDVSVLTSDPPAATRGAGIPPKSGGTETVTTLAAATTEIHAHANFRGDVAGIPLLAEARLDGENVRANASFPRVDSVKFATLLPELTGTTTLSAHAVVEGSLSEMLVIAHLDVDQGALDVQATVKDQSAIGHLSTRALSPNQLVQTAPSIPITSELDFSADAHVQSSQGTIAVPGLSAQVVAQHDGQEVRGSVEGIVLDASQLAPLFVPNVQSAGIGTFSARGSFDIQKQIVVLDASAALSNAAWQASRAGTVTLTASVHGPLTHPTINARAAGTALVAGGASLDDLQITVAGTTREAHITLRSLGPSIGHAVGHAARRTTGVAALIAATGEGEKNDDSASGESRDKAGALGLGFSRGSQKGERALLREPRRLPIDISATIRQEGDIISVHDAHIEGWGDPITADAKITKNDVSIDLRATRIDLAKVRRTLQLTQPLSGAIMLNAHGVVRGTDISGHATIDVTGTNYDVVHDASMHAELAVNEGAISLLSRGRVGDGAWFSLETTNIRLAGAPTSARALLNATGTVHLDAQVQHAHLQEWFPEAPTVSGQTRALLVIERRDPAQMPALDLTLAVQDTQVETKPRPTPKADLRVQAHVAENGQLVMHTELQPGQAKPTNIDVQATLPYPGILHGKIPGIDALMTAPFKADLTTPDSDLREVLASFGVSGRGTLQVAAHAEGSLANVRGSARATIHEFRSQLSPIRGKSEFGADFTYADGIGTVAATLVPPGGQKLTVAGEVRVPGPLQEWVASANLRGKDIPVRVPSIIGNTEASGIFTGDITLSDLHKDAAVRATIGLRNVQIGAAQVSKADFTASFEHGDLTLRTRIDDPEGHLEANLTTKGAWGSAMQPTLDAGASTKFGLSAKHFKLGVLQAFLPSSIDDFDGVLDADLNGEQDGIAGAPTLSGQASLKSGKLAAPSVGDLSDIEAKLTVDPNGTVHIERAQARAGSGLVVVSGAAKLQGLSLVDLTLVADIDKDHAFPVLASGQRAADIWGHVDVNVKPKERGWVVKIKVPRMGVILPENRDRVVQALGPQERVTIGYRRDGDIVLFATPTREIPATPTTITVDVHLGNDIHVEQGSLVRVAINGDLQVVKSDELTITGQIQVPRGKLDIRGKSFSIEQGTVTFDGPANNPTVILTASWDASDGSKVYADYTGRLQGGGVTLRSEPAHSNEEILSLLVFGTTNGPNVASQDTTSTVISQGAGYATEPINKALEQIVPLEIRTRVDTSQANAKPEVEVQIAQNISAQIGYVLGLPPPGANPDRYWLTLIWLFSNRWSLDATVGDRGSTIVEMSWQYRY